MEQNRETVVVIAIAADQMSDFLQLCVVPETSLSTIHIISSLLAFFMCAMSCIGVVVLWMCECVSFFSQSHFSLILLFLSHFIPLASDSSFLFNVATIYSNLPTRHSALSFLFFLVTLYDAHFYIYKYIT